MKKTTFLLIVIVIAMLVAQSCATIKVEAPAPEVVPVVAGQESSIVGQSGSWIDPVGVQVGVGLPVAKLNELMSIRAEINLSMQGARYEDTYPGLGLVKGRVNLLYANLPLVFRYQTKIGFFGEAGIQPGFLLSAKDKYSGQTDDYKESVKKFDFAIPFGAGYEFKNNIGVGVRVIPGITNINTEGTSKDRNFVVALRGTYTFRLK
jgi:hypothetical protein